MIVNKIEIYHMCKNKTQQNALKTVEQYREERKGCRREIEQV
jgi:hypothetical protein